MTESDLDAAVRRALKLDKPAATDPVGRFRNWLAVVLVGSFILSLPLLVWQTIPEGNRETITYILGQISGMALTVTSFYFVSKVQDAQLDKQRADTTQEAFSTIRRAIDAPAPATDPNSIREGDSVTLEKQP